MVHAHLSELMIVIVENGDLVRSLEDLNFKIPEDSIPPVTAALRDLRFRVKS
jgi:hypothetical protein